DKDSSTPTAHATTTGPRPTPTPTQVPFTACLLTDLGGINDNGYSAGAWAGITAAATDIGPQVKTHYIQSREIDTDSTNLLQLMSQGCDLIVGVGSLMQQSMLTVAAQNPRQQFALVDGAISLPNVYNLQYDTAQGAFLAGYLAAGYSKTGVVGTYGGMKI